MKHANISIFVPHKGCPNNCSFCNQKAISGQSKSATEKDVFDAVNVALSHNCNPKNTEIAFFGGSFTAIEREQMVSLLTAAKCLLDKYGFEGIRVSTRPDFIDDEVLLVLKKYGVTSIELGAQSMSDDVLALNHRGHTAEDVKKASGLIKQHGFSLGLQMMTGLYGSDFEKDYFTAREIIKLHPDTVRIYPTVVLKNTYLAELFLKGEYLPPTASQTAPFAARLLTEFQNEGIRVIKLGLHSSETVEGDMVAGAYHPAFREMCEGYIFLDKIEEKLKSKDKGKEYTVFVPKKSLSKAKGLNKRNEKALKNQGYYCKIKGKDFLDEFEIEVE
ncbi:MAG: radical SAM protein [Oscillospiraceae bacterium]|nr:radical SAM protein [Oscillospiraceae bacterium]